MSGRMRRLLASASLYASWVALATLGVLLVFQLHATLIFVGLQAVQNPTVNRLGWNTGTINGLSRFLYLVLGILWLGLVVFLENSLREAQRSGRLLNLVFRLFLGVGLLYGASYVILLLLA